MKIEFETCMVGDEKVNCYFDTDTGKITLGIYEDAAQSHDDLVWDCANYLDNEYDGMWLWRGKPIVYKRGDNVYKMTDLVHEHVEYKQQEQENNLYDFCCIKDGSQVIMVGEDEGKKYLYLEYIDKLYRYRNYDHQIETYSEGVALLGAIIPEDLDEAKFWLSALFEKEQDVRGKKLYRIIEIIKTWLTCERNNKSCLWYDFYYDGEQIEWINWLECGLNTNGEHVRFEGKRCSYESDRDKIAIFKLTDYDAIEQFLAGMEVYRITPPTKKRIDNWVETIR